MSDSRRSDLDELHHSLSSLQESQRSASLSILLMVIGVAVVLGSFIYSITRLRPLEAQIKERQTQRDNLQREINALKSEKDKIEQTLEAAKKEFDELGRSDIAEILNRKDITAGELNNLLEQSRKVNEELQKLKPTAAEKERRSGITIRYYPKKQDKNNVRMALEALKEYGFTKGIEVGEPRNRDTPTNAVCLVNQGFTEVDIKVIAYQLIRFGVQIKYIGPSPDRKLLRSLKDIRIHIQGQPELIHDLPLTFEQVSNLSLQRMWEGTRRLAPTPTPQ